MRWYERRRWKRLTKETIFKGFGCGIFHRGKWEGGLVAEGVSYVEAR